MRSQPLFHFDVGWLFVIAGLALCVSVALIPAQYDLDRLKAERALLEHDETRAFARLRAYEEFIAAIEQDDPALLRRLAAAQLNIVPEGETPVLVHKASLSTSIIDWIEASGHVDAQPVHSVHESRLGRLANGQYRHWLMGSAGLCLLIGIVLGPGGRVEG